jgi:hypothetical protein
MTANTIRVVLSVVDHHMVTWSIVECGVVIGHPVIFV